MLKNIKKVLPGTKFTCEITKNIVEIQRKGFLVLPNGQLDTTSKIVYDTYEEAHECLINRERTFRNHDTIIDEALKSNIVVYDPVEEGVSSERLFNLGKYTLDNLDDELMTLHASQEMLRHFHNFNGRLEYIRDIIENIPYGIFHDEFMWDEKVIGEYKELGLIYQPNKKHLVIFQGRYQSIFGAY